MYNPGHLGVTAREAFSLGLCLTIDSPADRLAAVIHRRQGAWQHLQRLQLGLKSYGGVIAVLVQ